MNQCGEVHNDQAPSLAGLFRTDPFVRASSAIAHVIFKGLNHDHELGGIRHGIQRRLGVARTRRNHGHAYG